MIKVSLFEGSFKCKLSMQCFGKFTKEGQKKSISWCAEDIQSYLAEEVCFV